jgi:glycosyltransferase involved in cell wall biosynthesis
MTKPIKVIHLVPGLGIGGTEKQVRLLLTHLDPTRWNVQLWALKGWGPLGDRLKKSGIDVETFDGTGIQSTRWLMKRISQRLTEEQPEILHTWLTPANAIGRLVARGLDIRIVSSLRVVPWGKYIPLERLTHRFCQMITVNAEAVRKFAENKLKIPASKIRFIPNGWEKEHSVPASLNLPKSWRDPNVVIIGSAGRLETQKDFPNLFSAFRRVLAAYPNSRLIIAGDGSLRGQLEGMAAKPPFKDRVILAGALLGLDNLLRQIDIFVLSSISEGTPNVIIEAMAQGVPVVATNVGGIGELVTSKTGVLVRSGDSKALAHGIEQTLSNLEKTKHQAKQFSNTIQKKYSIDRTVKLTETLYDELLRGVV